MKEITLDKNISLRNIFYAFNNGQESLFFVKIWVCFIKVCKILMLYSEEFMLISIASANMQCNFKHRFDISKKKNTKIKMHFLKHADYVNINYVHGLEYCIKRSA